MEQKEIEQIPGEEFEIKVDKKQEPMRLDKFLYGRLFNITRNKLQSAIKEGIILVNGKAVKPNYKVRGGDIVTGVIPKKRPPHLSGVKAEDIPLDIVYEDEHLMVVNKPSGMVVHPGISNYSGTLVNAVKYHLDNESLPVMEGNFEDRPGIVHRIDKETTGLLLIAKNDEALTHLAKQFFDHTIEREYYALVWGSFKEKEGTIDLNIGRNPKNRKLMTVFPEGEAGKKAVTHYKVLEDLYYVSLISCRLETGRTHQIRVHMKHLGHPVFNDSSYGGDKIVKGTVFTKYKQFVMNNMKMLPGHALHARSLGFIHPATGEKMYFEAGLPKEFQTVLERWRNYVKSKL